MTALVLYMNTGVCFFVYLDDPGPLPTLTKRVERCILESSTIGTSKGGVRNVCVLINIFSYLKCSLW